MCETTRRYSAWSQVDERIWGMRRRRAERARESATGEGVEVGERMRSGMCSRRVIKARPGKVPVRTIRRTWR